MVGKKSGKALLREEGLERTDNNLEFTSWPQIPMINQKNYYTEFLKRDDQVLSLRLQNEEHRSRMMRVARDRDRALAQSGHDGLIGPEADIDIEEDIGAEESGGLYGYDASKIIVIHPGSQNLRVGLASDALPKTTPMCIARKSKENEAEENGGEPRPKRRKLEDGTVAEPEEQFGDEFASHFTRMSTELKEHLRSKKYRLMPNSRELAVNFNKKVVPERISEHNDLLRIEWSEVPKNPRQAPDFFTGLAALRIPEQSTPRYKVVWPLQSGTFNEADYSRKNLLFQDLSTIIEEAIKGQLNLTSRKEWTQYGCVFIIPDLYERVYVTTFLDILLREFGFARVCFIQESLAATFGAGLGSSCVVDIGAQKTSICCVEDGMCLESSRVSLKMGGSDVTDVFIKMLLFDYFPYADINLRRRYDFLLADELKHSCVSMHEGAVAVVLREFHVRASGRDTEKYQYKTYDEIMLAPMGYFQPVIFDHSNKLKGRRRLIARSYDMYDGSPNDPMSSAQASVLQFAASSHPNHKGAAETNVKVLNGEQLATPSQRLQPVSTADRVTEIESRSHTPLAGSPGVEGFGTPHASRAYSPALGAQDAATTYSIERDQTAEEMDHILPVMPLDMAIIASITEGAHSDERKMRDFYGGIMLTGGGALIPGFHGFLEERLKLLRPGYQKEMLVGIPPREMDPSVVVWKGGSVFGKLRGTNDSWIGQLEYDRLGARVMAYKCMWPW